MDVAGRVALRFTGDVVRGGSHDNLTAARADGEHLWVAGDPHRPVSYTHLTLPTN